MIDGSAGGRFLATGVLNWGRTAGGIFYQMHTTVPPTLADQRQYWDARWGQTPSPNEWQRRRADTILQMLGPLNLQNPRILDVGCATGWFTEKLSHLGPAMGVDLSERAIEIARHCYPGVPFQAGDFYEMNLPKAHFDLVVSQEVVAHVAGQEEFLRRLAEVTAPGGYLVITTANKFVMERVDFGPDSQAHIKQWLSARRLKALVSAHYRVLKAKYVIPLGGRGVLRIANSYKLNAFLRLFLPEESIDRLKERAGLAYSLVVLAVRR